MEKYRLGNQTKEYELCEAYLGWVPKGEKDWQLPYSQDVRNTEITIVNPDRSKEKVLFLHHFIIKDAFPMSFYEEKRAENWWNFAIVSDGENSEKFIIPMH